MAPSMTLFGGDFADWTDSDDRVRGGSSQSYLDPSSNKKVARFHGNLDIKTLGGAGFASQRTTTDTTWDLSRYTGIALEVYPEEDKSLKFTFIVKDELLPPDLQTGREQASISWEGDFVVPRRGEAEEEEGMQAPADEEKALYSEGKDAEKPVTIKLAFASLTPTYRGRKVKGGELCTAGIRRLSVMVRSHFGEQEGPFSVRIRSVSAYRDKEEGVSPGSAWARQWARVTSAPGHGPAGRAGRAVAAAGLLAGVALAVWLLRGRRTLQGEDL